MEKNFGSLTVLKYYEGGSVRCRCDCGKEFVTERLYLHSGELKDCGCGISTSEKDNKELKKYSENFYKTLESFSDDNPNMESNQFVGRKKGNRWILTENEIRSKLSRSSNNLTIPNNGDISKEISIIGEEHGFIVVCKNKYMPNIFRVIGTIEPVEEALSSLNEKSDFPYPYQIVTCFKTPNLNEDLAAISAKLAESRIAEGSDFYEIDLESLLKTINSNYTAIGFVYILSNPSMPGIFKIGCTKRNVEERVAELVHTGLPTPFNIEASFEVANPEKCEKAVHQKLDQHRVQSNREFFKADLEIIFEVVKEICDNTI